MRSPDEARPRWLSGLRAAEVLLLLAAALFALVFHLRLPGRLPTEADHAAAAAHLAQRAEAGDVVLLFPWWTERARLFLPESLPVVGYLGSDSADLADHPRIWVYSQPRLPRANEGDFEARYGPKRTQLGQTAHFGTLSLRLFSNGRHRPKLFSAAEAVASARVYLEGPDGRRVDCTFDGRAHRCPGAPAHVNVAAEWHDLRYQPRRCLWMHPPGGPTRLVAEFPSVPAGDQLWLEGGIIWEHAPNRAPPVTALQVGVEDARTGRRLSDVVIPPGLEGMQRAQFSLPPQTQALKLWVQSDNPTARQACVELTSREALTVGTL